MEKEKSDLIHLNKELKAIDRKDFIKLCDTFLPKKISDFVKVQVALADRKVRGERYTNSFKYFALTLYFLSPKCYKFLRSIFRLPARCTLNIITTQWQHSPGLNDNLFKALKVKVNRMSKMERHISLVVDELSTKPFLYYNISTDEVIGLDTRKQQDINNIQCSNHAMVLMATGISKRFKQALGYVFSKSTYNGEDLLTIVRECINKLTEIGFIVSNFISDMGSNFIAMANKLTAKKSFIRLILHTFLKQLGIICGQITLNLVEIKPTGTI